MYRRPTAIPSLEAEQTSQLGSESQGGLADRILDLAAIDIACYISELSCWTTWFEAAAGAADIYALAGSLDVAVALAVDGQERA